MAAHQVNITDRAKRYRAQNNVTGPRKCVLCGSTSDLGVMHLTGNESHGETANLAYGCRSCNGKLAAAFKAVGAGKPTNQYNPSSGVPTFEQYMWAVSNHERKAHDAGGAVIHATPKHKRIEYARRIVSKAQQTKRDRLDDRWNPSKRKKKWGENIVFYNGPDQELAHEALKRALIGGYVGVQKKKYKGEWYVTAESARSTENPWPFSRPDARRTTPAHGGIAFHQAKAKSRKSPDDRNAEFLKTLPKSKAKKPAGRVPTFDELEEGYKRGLSLRDILQQNPSLGSGKTLAERLKWLETDARRILAAPQNHKPDEVAWANLMLSTPHKRNSAPNATTAKHERDIRAYIAEKSAAGKSAEQIYRAVWRRWGYQGQAKSGAVQLKMHDGIETFRVNPASASAEVFEDFHGFEPTEVVTVSKKVHHHAHLASLGTLVQLDVWGVDGRGHKITGFKKALLACNETRDQLFIEGGDQSVNLADFGIRKPHETETLGRVTNIGYQTNKTHLGDEGGEAVYVHRFRATNENGKHVVVKMTREPDLIYDVRNEQLLFSGGSYEILREGINK